MTVAVAAPPPRHQVRRRFYLAMSLVLGVIVVIGFSQTVPGDLAPPGLPTLLKLHAAAFVAWILLFVAQPALVFRGSLRLHRKLGWLGAALACLMVTLGGWAIIFALRSQAVPPFYPKAFFLIRGLLELAAFAGLVIAGVATRRAPEWHKRFMLLASIVIVGPAVERAIPIPLLGAAWPLWADAILDLLVLAGPAVDLAARRQVHPAYSVGFAAIIVMQITTYAAAASPLGAALLSAVEGG